MPANALRPNLSSCTVSPRRRLPPFALALLVLSMAASSRAQDTYSLPVVYKVPGMDAVRVEEGRVYKRADGAALTMNVASPAGEATGPARPVIVFIHGGPLGRNVARPATDWGVYGSYGRLAAALGFVGVTFNFRYYDATREGLERAAADVTDAVAHVRENAPRWHADPQRMCLWTFSGGGPMLAPALRGSVSGVRCLVSYYAVLDAGPGNDDFSPATVPLPRGQAVSPIFIGRGGLDSPSINRSVDAFLARAFNGGFNVTLANHPAGRHGFDILDDDERSREIIASTFEFVRAHTAGAEPQPETRLGPRVAALYGSLLDADTSLATRLADPAAWPGAGAALRERVVSENTVLRVAYPLLRGDKRGRGVQLLEWLVQQYPDSPTARDRLAEAYETVGRKEDAEKATATALVLADRAKLSDEAKAALREAAAARRKRLAAAPIPK